MDTSTESDESQQLGPSVESDPSNVQFEDGIFIDNLFLQYFAKLVEKDIIILPVHPQSGRGSIGDFPDFTWVKGKFNFV